MLCSAACAVLCAAAAPVTAAASASASTLPLPPAASHACLQASIPSSQPSSSTSSSAACYTRARDLALDPASFFSPAKYLAHLTVISPAPCMKASLTLSVFATNSSISIDCRCRHPVAVLSCLYSCLSCLVQSTPVHTDSLRCLLHHPSPAALSSRGATSKHNPEPSSPTQPIHHSPPRAHCCSQTSFQYISALPYLP